MKQKKIKLDMDIEKALLEDDAFKEGANNFERMSEQAQLIADEITSALIAQVIKTNEAGDKANNFDLSTALLAVSKTLTNLTCYLYDEEKEFLDTVKIARGAAIQKLIPALLNPQPCGLCPECKSGKPCSNPVMDTKLLQTRSLPIVSACLIEYDMWNKMMYQFTVKNQAEDKAKKQEE